jgi:hypothetical protein
MHRGRGTWPAMAALGSLVALSGCGGGGGPTTIPTPAPTPTPCTQSMVEQDAETIDSFNLIYFDFPVPESGRLDVTLDWTFAASSMGFYLVPANTCTLEQFNSRSCTFVIRSEPSSGKPRKLSLPVVNAGNYRWVVGNFASVQESFSLAIVLSKGGCPAHAGGAPGASAVGGASGAPPQAAGMTGR